MKSYMKIVTFVYAFTLAVTLLNAVDLYDYEISADTDWIDDVSSMADQNSDETYVNNGIMDRLESLVASVGDFIFGLLKFVELTVRVLIWPKGIFDSLGFPAIIGNIVQYIISFAYLIAFIEFVSGRPIERN